MLCSMSREGNCWDNAPTESWFGGFKNEPIHGEAYVDQQKMREIVSSKSRAFFTTEKVDSLR
jgi:hypothetical protein